MSIEDEEKNIDATGADLKTDLVVEASDFQRWRDGERSERWQCTACGAELLAESVDGLGGHSRMADDGHGNPIEIHCGPCFPTTAEETEQGFTPGEWRVKESKVPGFARNVDVVAGDLLICDVTGGGVSNPVVLAQVRANARLIAAAPALYEALTDLIPTAFQHSWAHLENVDGCCCKQCCVDRAYAALVLVNKPDTNSANSDDSTDGQANDTK